MTTIKSFFIGMFLFFMVGGTALYYKYSKTPEAKARTLFEQNQAFADLGHKDAQFNLGILHSNGHGTTKNSTEAAEWYRKAAEQGLAKAQHTLGVIYSEGLGVPIDQSESVKWYMKAAKQNHAESQFNLGIKYHKGEGTVKDLMKARSWYRKAAQQGIAGAHYNLGHSYIKANQNKLNKILAYQWISLAKREGEPRASEAILKLSKHMSPSEINEAKALAIQCSKSNYINCD